MLGFIAKVGGAAAGAAAASSGHPIAVVGGIIFSILMGIWAVLDIFHFILDVINYLF